VARKHIASEENMFYNTDMDVVEKLAGIENFMDFEPDGEVPVRPSGLPPGAVDDCPFKVSQGPRTPVVKPASQIPIYMAALPNGKRMPILKTLLTSACERNCYYCFCRAGRDFRRETFRPAELAKTCVELYQRGIIKGAFLSSGIAGGGQATQDRLLATAEILRTKLNFRGYLHLKIMPGSDAAQVERAMQLADRVSVNLEAPTTERLKLLAPQKMMLDELLKPLRWVEEIRQNQAGINGWQGRWPSSTTQFVVGAAGENDLELLKASEYLYQKLRLKRVYFSGFNPVQGTPLENLPPLNPWREFRLYQASFLLRDYSFGLEELPFAQDGDLPLNVDPKMAWAQSNLSESPLEVNQVEQFQLMRIPGIGPKAASAILVARRKGHLHSIEDLRALGIRTARAAPFILIDGRRPVTQLALW
jgi:predicted DNA-binding helix-hairpin-helix protein